MNSQPLTQSIDQQVTRLQGDLGTLVQILIEGLNRRLSSYKIDAVEYTVLSVCLNAGTISTRDLKSLLPIDPGHMSRTTNQLEDKGLIEKARDSDDRRLVVLRMTEHGSALTAELIKRVHEFYGLLVVGISLEELVGCIAVMERMITPGEGAEDRPAPPAPAVESYSSRGGNGSGMANGAQGQVIESQFAKLQGNVTALINVMFSGIQERVSQFELAVGEYSVFATCFTNGPITVSDLAQHVPVGVTRISRIVSKLEDRDLVRKVRPNRDRRVVIVEVTSKGRTLALELMAGVGEHYASIAGRVREHELTDLLNFIERMTANAERTESALIS